MDHDQLFPIALFSWDSPRDAEADQYVVEFPGRRVLEFNFVVIQLNRLNWRDYLNADNAAASALMAKMGVKPEERPKVRAACLRMLIRLKLPRRKWRPITKFIDAYLPLTEAQEKEFDDEIGRLKPRERRKAVEYITSWERKGYEKGKLEGELKGKLEGRLEDELKGKLEVVLKLLSHRFSDLSATMRKQISKLSAAQLDELAEALFEFHSKADLSQWLKQNGA